MPKDTGSVTNNTVMLAEHRAARAAEEPVTVGAQLRAAREAQGLTLQQVAELTRVRRAYLAAIEDMRGDLLPSRPFAVGYAKSYAKALGLDGEMVAERFRSELPDPDAQSLRAPIGVQHEKGGVRYPLLIGAGAVLAVAVLLWNVAQRAVTFQDAVAPEVPEAPQAWLAASAPTAPVPIGTPTPAPSEQTTPAPYVTPGLDAFAAGEIIPLQIPGAMPVNTVTLPPAPPPATANGVRPVAHGAGAPAQTVSLVARSGVAVIVKDPRGQIIFARHLSPGDSWRSPPAPGYTVEVSKPEAVDVYAFGRFKGQLAGAVVSLQQLAR
ncbi:MAG TPA: helix-turn-helix domain-containing protein [Caulobacteraceae bacterium]|jgi:cytoskeletal protein RodZ